ncbi:MAG: 50S ribosomal protein L22 [Patescibacteria group bacterium]|nr:50S ribosomal protein L22 [Patescibacteria group bacterium]
MKIQAKINYLRISPRKVRVVLEAVKKMPVSKAMEQLQFMPKKSALPLLKLLKSAVANAENNFKLKKENLEISEFRADKGSVLKRWMPRAQGRATPIHKFTTHVTLILEDKTVTEVKKEKKEKQEKGDDVVVVKDWDEAKKLVKEEVEENVHSEGKEATTGEEHKPDIEDIRMEGKHREKQHLDKIRKKSKGGILKRVFRRKSV